MGGGVLPNKPMNSTRKRVGPWSIMTRAVWVQTCAQREHLMQVKVGGGFYQPSSSKGCQPSAREGRSGREHVLTEYRQAALAQSHQTCEGIDSGWPQMQYGAENHPETLTLLPPLL